ncbi:Predicted DNA-binding protein, UPF0251 family [[Clostridium] fimetarium]|uniref:Predicted DNA-binding protein, UPF0251 family n=2 Tax=[Clostridium] fimetarium TaxID=99656 RepID=A0A1I0RS47_9FIRM|nr:Predicted DNA-binding protein, UPF0251 family [[Clostridium] fimetarium]
MPQNVGFEPIGENKNMDDFVKLNVDEYEVIRLIDFEKLTQEQCATQMFVSRTTITSIYGLARYKMADALINGKKLMVSGGEFKLCEHNRECCRKGRLANESCIDLFGDVALKMKNHIKENEKMRIAVTYENGQIFQHFGHTEQFKIYEVVDNKVISSQVIDTMGNGHESLAGFLKTQNVDTLICGGIGGGAKESLEEAGIKLYGGANGEADLSVENLLTNTLEYNPEVVCKHHDNEEHNGGEHSCGSHS